MTPHHPTQGEGVSPQVECTHVVRLFRLRRTLMVSVVVESSPALAVPPGQTDSRREGSHCRLAATGAATRAQLHAYPGGGNLRGLPPSVNPSGNNIHTHTSSSPALAVPPGQTDSLREGSHCRLAATGAATRAQLHAYPGGGSLRGLPARSRLDQPKQTAIWETTGRY